MNRNYKICLFMPIFMLFFLGVIHYDSLLERLPDPIRHYGLFIYIGSLFIPSIVLYPFLIGNFASKKSKLQPIQEDPLIEKDAEILQAQEPEKSEKHLGYSALGFSGVLIASGGILFIGWWAIMLVWGAICYFAKCSLGF